MGTKSDQLEKYIHDIELRKGITELSRMIECIFKLSFHQLMAYAKSSKRTIREWKKDFTKHRNQLDDLLGFTVLPDTKLIDEIDNNMFMAYIGAVKLYKRAMMECDDLPDVFEKSPGTAPWKLTELLTNNINSFIETLIEERLDN